MYIADIYIILIVLRATNEPSVSIANSLKQKKQKKNKYRVDSTCGKFCSTVLSQQPWKSPITQKNSRLDS